MSGFKWKKIVPQGLTAKQKEVFLKMDQEHYFLYCNEGSNYKCWLEKENNPSSRINLNRRTGEALVDKGIVIPDNSFNSNISVYRFKLK